MAVLLWLSIGADTTNAQQLPPPRAAPHAPTVALTAIERRWTGVDERHAQHIAPVTSAWRLGVDSIVNGEWFARMPGDVGLRYRVDGVLRMPIARERLGTPIVTPVPSRLRNPPSFGVGGAVLTLSDAERAAQLETIRNAATLATAFDGLPDRPSRLHITQGSNRIALTLDATRQYRVLGDSVVNGRAVRIVRDSTSIAYTHRTMVPSRFTAVIASSTDQMHGSIVGTRIVDLGSRRTVTMHDTVRLRGRRQLDDGYGGVTDLPAYEHSTRSVTVRDSLSRTMTEEPFDMARTSEAAALLNAMQFDSVLVRLRATASIVERDSIRDRYRYVSNARWHRNVVDQALALGDTAAAALWITGNPYGVPRAAIAVERFTWLRTLLHNAAAAQRAGVDRELLAINLIDGLLHTPPVLAIGTPDSAVCTPAACQAMAGDAANRHASMVLRAVALTAAMVTTPRIWTDSVIAYARTNPLLAGQARWFALGTASTAAASAKAPIPDITASAEEWRFWLAGEDSAYVQYREGLRGGVPNTALPFRRSFANFGTDHVGTAIRFAEQRTGRAYSRTLREQRMRATDDSTRALFSTLLLAMRDSVFTTPELIALVLGPVGQEQQVAVQQITRQPRTPLAPAPDSIAAVLGMQLIESLYGGAPLKLTGLASIGLRLPREPRIDSLANYLSMDSLPASVRDGATALGHAPMPRGWQLPSGTAGIVTYIGAPKHAGPFVRIDVSFFTLYARGSTTAGGFASGYTLWFVEGLEGWVVFSQNSWVT